MKQIFRQILVTEDYYKIVTMNSVNIYTHRAVLTSRDDIEGFGYSEDAALKDLFRKLIEA